MVLTEEGERQNMEEKGLSNTIAEKEDILRSSEVSGAAFVSNMASATVTTTNENANNVENEKTLNNIIKPLSQLEIQESPKQTYKEEKYVAHQNNFQQAFNLNLSDHYQNNQHQHLPIPPLIQEYPTKHPLQNTWTLWYLESDRTKSWEELQNEITSFNTVEDFWCLYNHIKLASEIKTGSDYSLFKRGIRPMWEDDANVEGGRWMITLSRQYRRAYLDKLWLDVLLCLIGEVFDYSGQICGAVVNIRSKTDKISVWTVDGNARDAIFEIGNKLKEYLTYDPERFTLVYQTHKDTMSKQGSSIRNIYTL